MGLFVASTAYYIRQNNQFIDLTEGEQAALEAVYTRFLAEQRDLLAAPREPAALAEGLRSIIARHLIDLQLFVDDLAETHGYGGATLVDRPVVNTEYRPTLQLRVLGIKPERLDQPVLDVGCGRQGGLVRYLRERGIEAVGIDRVVAPQPGLVEADWLDFSYDDVAWGTIIAHLSFTNHFLFHHLYRDGRPEVYAANYMELLNALQVGGAFYYTPSLPFIEDLLPAEHWRVDRKHKPAEATRIVRVG